MRGPLLVVEIGVPARIAQLLKDKGMEVPAPTSGPALVDTGAAGCVIDSAAASQLNLQQVGSVQVMGVSAP